MFGKARNEEIHQQGKYLKLKIPSHFFQVLKMWKSSDFKFSQVHMKGTLDSKISYFGGWNPFREKKLDSKDFLTFFWFLGSMSRCVCKENNLIYTLLHGRRRDNLSFEDEETPDIVSCYSWIQFQDGHAMSWPTKQSTGRPDKKGNSWKWVTELFL